MDGPADKSEELILRDHLAMDRTQLANERTLLAYLRTALMLIVTGATILKFLAGSHILAITGWLLITLGVFVAAFGAWRFRTMRTAMRRRCG